MKIIARKPRDDYSEYAVIQRKDRYHPFVSATISPQTLKHSEWCWGHYFETKEQALDHFNNR